MPLYRYKQSRPSVHPSAFIAPGARIIRDVRIGRDASAWFQTVIRAVIGQGSVIGANALVLEGTIIPAYSLVSDHPGR